jgi:hypothetical protein
MTLKRQLMKCILLLCSLSIVYGCAAAWFTGGGLAALGGYRWVEGRLSRDYPIAYADAWDVANKALENLGISISNSIDEGGKGRIEAVNKDGKKITLILKDQGIGVTRIVVVVGLFSDREVAERVHDEIWSISRTS